MLDFFRHLLKHRPLPSLSVELDKDIHESAKLFNAFLLNHKRRIAWESIDWTELWNENKLEKIKKGWPRLGILLTNEIDALKDFLAAENQEQAIIGRFFNGLAHATVNPASERLFPQLDAALKKEYPELSFLLDLLKKLLKELLHLQKEFIRISAENTSLGVKYEQIARLKTERPTEKKLIESISIILHTVSIEVRKEMPRIRMKDNVVQLADKLWKPSEAMLVLLHKKMVASRNKKMVEWLVDLRGSLQKTVLLLIDLYVQKKIDLSGDYLFDIGDATKELKKNPAKDFASFKPEDMPVDEIFYDRFKKKVNLSFNKPLFQLKNRLRPYFTRKKREDIADTVRTIHADKGLNALILTPIVQAFLLGMKERKVVISINDFVRHPDLFRLSDMHRVHELFSMVDMYPKDLVSFRCLEQILKKDITLEDMRRLKLLDHNKLINIIFWWGSSVDQKILEFVRAHPLSRLQNALLLLDSGSMADFRLIVIDLASQKDEVIHVKRMKKLFNLVDKEKFSAGRRVSFSEYYSCLKSLVSYSDAIIKDAVKLASCIDDPDFSFLQPFALSLSKEEYDPAILKRTEGLIHLLNDMSGYYKPSPEAYQPFFPAANKGVTADLLKKLDRIFMFSFPSQDTSQIDGLIRLHLLSKQHPKSFNALLALLEITRKDWGVRAHELSLDKTIEMLEAILGHINYDPSFIPFLNKTFFASRSMPEDLLFLLDHISIMHYIQDTGAKRESSFKEFMDSYSYELQDYMSQDKDYVAFRDRIRRVLFRDAQDHHFRLLHYYSSFPFKKAFLKGKMDVFCKFLVDLYSLEPPTIAVERFFSVFSQQNELLINRLSINAVINFIFAIHKLLVSLLRDYHGKTVQHIINQLMNRLYVFLDGFQPADLQDLLNDVHKTFLHPAVVDWMNGSSHLKRIILGAFFSMKSPFKDTRKILQFIADEQMQEQLNILIEHKNELSVELLVHRLLSYDNMTEKIDALFRTLTGYKAPPLDELLVVFFALNEDRPESFDYLLERFREPKLQEVASFIYTSSQSPLSGRTPREILVTLLEWDINQESAIRTHFYHSLILMGWSLEKVLEAENLIRNWSFDADRIMDLFKDIKQAIASFDTYLQQLRSSVPTRFITKDYAKLIRNLALPLGFKYHILRNHARKLTINERGVIFALLRPWFLPYSTKTFRFHGTEERYFENIIDNEQGIKIMHHHLTGAFSGDIGVASSYNEDNSMVLILSLFFPSAEIVPDKDSNIWNVHDKDGYLVRIPGCFCYDASDPDLYKEFSAAMTRGRKTFESFFEQADQVTKSTIERITGSMIDTYPDEKLIEVLDFYMRSAYFAEGHNTYTKRKIIFDTVSSLPKPEHRAPSYILLAELLQEHPEELLKHEGRLTSWPALQKRIKITLDAMYGAHAGKLKSILKNQNYFKTLKKQLDYGRSKFFTQEERKNLLFSGKNGEHSRKLTDKVEKIIVQNRTAIIKRAFSEGIGALESDDASFSKKHQNRIAMASVGSISREEMVISSDLDFMMIIDDTDLPAAEMNLLATILNKVGKNIEQTFKHLGFDWHAFDFGKLNDGKEGVLCISMLASLTIRKSPSRNTIEPTGIIDLVPIINPDVVERFKIQGIKTLLQSTNQQTIIENLKNDLQKFYLYSRTFDTRGNFVEAISQLIAGDAIRNVKFGMSRMVTFLIFYHCFKHLSSDIPSSNILRIDWLRKKGAISREDAKRFKKLILNTLKWRLRADLLNMAGGIEFDSSYLSPEEMIALQNDLFFIENSYNLIR